MPSLALYEPFQDAKQNKQCDYVCANAVHVEGGIDLTMSDSIRAQCMSSRLIHQKCTLTLISSMSSSEPPSIPRGEQTGDMGFSASVWEQFVSGSDWKSTNRPAIGVYTYRQGGHKPAHIQNHSLAGWGTSCATNACINFLAAPCLLRGISNFQPKSLPQFSTT